MQNRLLIVVCLFAVSVASNANPPTGKYKKIVDALQALQQENASVSHIFSIGQNDEGTELYAIRISATPQVMDPTKIGQLVVSTHHGDETGAPLFTMKFIEDLLNRYQSDEFWKGRLADQEWTVVPVLNVSGYNATSRREYGKDPNRDYPSPCTSHPGGALKSIKTIIDFMATRIFTGTVTVHGYDGSLTYPWGMYLNDYKTLDDNQYRQIFQKAAAVNGYRYGTAAEIVYPANGCYEDYVYHKHGMWSLLLELSSGSESDITATVPAIAKYFELLDSSPSTKNQLTSSCTGDRGPDLRVE